MRLNLLLQSILDEAADDDKEKKKKAKDEEQPPAEDEGGEDEAPAEGEGEEEPAGDEDNPEGEEGEDPPPEGEEDTPPEGEEGEPPAEGDEGGGDDAGGGEGEGGEGGGDSPLGDDFSLDGDDPAGGEGGGEDDGPAPDGLPEPDDDGSGDEEEMDPDGETNVHTNILNLSKMDRALAKKTCYHNYMDLRSSISATLSIIDKNETVIDPDVREHAIDELNTLQKDLEDYLLYKFQVNNFEDTLTAYFTFVKKLNDLVKYVETDGIKKK